MIVLNDIGFSFNKNSVLEHISFSIEKGEYVGIIGPNGGGKTTLLKIILRLLKPTEGSIEIKTKRVGYVPQKIDQDLNLFPATVEEIVRSGGKKSADRAMEIMGIALLRHRLISQLSGGQRQRVFIARALASDPEILVLDEPNLGIDPASQKSFIDRLEILNKKHGITILLVSHDTDVVAKTVTRCICINRTLLCHGEPYEIMTPEFLEKLYGKHHKLLEHHHHHG